MNSETYTQGRHRRVHVHFWRRAAYLLYLAAPFLLVACAAWGAMQTYLPRTAGLIAKHGRKFSQFSGIGLFVLLTGIGVQWALVKSTGAYWSYIGQAVFSVELSYVLNRQITWRDRKAPLWSSLAKWNTQKLVMTVPNLAGYGLLVWLGLNWLAANLAITAVFTVINYITGDIWSFAKRGGKALPKA
jgi:putative flippase GtrA